MTYFAPYIDDSGLNIPTYQDIENYLVTQAQSIYGTDIYLGNDSQDFQFIAGIAQLVYDTLLSAQLAYYNYSPVTAVGASLDSVVAINGVKRRTASSSIVSVTLSGTAYTVITNGQIADTNGNKWDLPETVTLNSEGTSTVTATCQATGTVSALPGQVSVILTPTNGWTSVTNTYAATPGQAQETDAALRARQAQAVANPSQALTTGILGSILSLDNVVSAQIWENDSNAYLDAINNVPNPDEFPPHSITLVVDGGDDSEIASMLALRKTPGCYVNGDQEVTVYDQYGVPGTMRFYRPTEIGIEVTLTIRSLNGYSSAIGDSLKEAVIDYLNGLVAGQSIIISELWQAALASDTASYPTFSLTGVTANLHGSGYTPDTEDIALNFNEKAITQTAYISLVVT